MERRKRATVPAFVRSRSTHPRLRRFRPAGRFRGRARLIEYKGALINAATRPTDAIRRSTRRRIRSCSTQTTIYTSTRASTATRRAGSITPAIRIARAVQEGRRVFIESIRPIRPGEEIVYDYRIMLDGRTTRTAQDANGSAVAERKNCRGTMLARGGFAIGRLTSRARALLPSRGCEPVRAGLRLRLRALGLRGWNSKPMPPPGLFTR